MSLVFALFAPNSVRNESRGEMAKINLASPNAIQMEANRLIDRNHGTENEQRTRANIFFLSPSQSYIRLRFDGQFAVDFSCCRNVKMRKTLMR